MPARTIKLPDEDRAGVRMKGARVLVATCEVCGEPASFLIDADPKGAVDQKDKSKMGKAYCLRHVPPRTLV